MQQLTGMDTLFLTQESDRAPLHISPLLIYDPSTAPGGLVRFTDILRLFTSRLHLAPIFRRRLVEVPFGLDHPYWIESADFDLEFHVRHIALPKPGDWRQLCIQIARLHSQALDRSRPLWEAYVIEGLDNVEGLPPGCFALFLKMHHAAIDGVSGAEIIGAINDTSPAQPPQEDLRARRWRPEVAPNAARLLARAALGNLRQPGRILQTAAELAPALRRVREGMRSNRFRAIRERVNTRFNGRITAHRSVDARFFPLTAIKSIKDHVPGVTVNDVVVTIVAGALRQYLLAKGELPAVSLIAGAPINVRDSDDHSSGNLISVMTLSIYTDIADPLERLHRVHAECVASREYSNAVGARTLSDLTQMIPPRIAALGFRAASEAMLLTGARSPINTIISNVPGPQVPLYLCGARLVCSAGCGPLIDHMGLFHAILSYEGGLSLTVTACREMLPDPAFYADCIQSSFEELQAAAQRLGRTRRKAMTGGNRKAASRASHDPD
jgi:diacylglycerol O-acyltransferase / wax synthase